MCVHISKLSRRGRLRNELAQSKHTCEHESNGWPKDALQIQSHRYKDIGGCPHIRIYMRDTLTERKNQREIDVIVTIFFGQPSICVCQLFVYLEL